MRVIVDDEKCQGHGRCYSLAPELFEPDDLGQSRTLSGGVVAPGQEELARKAVLNCPESAISITEEDR